MILFRYTFVESVNVIKKKKKKSRLLSEMRRTGERGAESRNNSIRTR